MSDKRTNPKYWPSTGDISKEEDRIVGSVAMSVDNLPILARLEFAKMIVFARGGDRENHGIPQDPMLVLVHHLLEDVIEVLQEHPNAANLRNPYTKPISAKARTLDR